MLNNLQELEKLHQKHIDYRKKCLNLIASENYSSLSVRRYLTSDFGNRYGCYPNTMKPKEREYAGTRYIHEFEMATQELVKDVFHATYVDLRPIGGHMAGVATVLGLTLPGDLILEVSGKHWGHELVLLMQGDEHFKQTIRRGVLPFTNDLLLDMNKLKEMIREEPPKFIILGSSASLFHDPIEELITIADEYNILIGYDFSHVTGLIAGGVFPNPLDQGADVMFGSTHKSFPGPQGGMILTKNSEVLEKIGKALYPALVTSHHLNRLPALAASMIEMKKYGNAYAKQIANNSKALGKAMEEKGFKVIASGIDYTETHLILVDVGKFGSSRKMANLLEEANIICCGDQYFGGMDKEIRIGTAEATRRGMEESEMKDIAEFVKRIIIDKEEPSVVAKDVERYVNNYLGCKYSLD